MLSMFRFFCCLIFSIFLSAPAFAQYGGAPSFPEFDVSTVTSNYMGAKTPNTRLQALSDNMMGEQHDIDTGGLSFRHVDVSLPGNFALPVEFARRSNGLSYMHGSGQRDAFGNGWDVDVPYVRMRSFSGQSGNCYTTVGGTGSRTAAYNIGTKVNIPGQGEQNAGPNLKSFWLTQCRSGGGLLVKSPKGDIYEMAKKIIRSDGYPVRSAYGGTTDQILDNVFWYATKVTDVNGNWVQYSYNQHGPTRIWSSDGREITITYSGDLITRVTANGRSWNYSYNNVSGNTPYGSYNYDYLSRVTLPDGRYWSFGENEQGMIASGSPSRSACSQVQQTGQTFGFAKYLRHPSGTKARFGTKLIWNVIEGAPSAPFGGGGNPCSAGTVTPKSFAVYALGSKKLTTTDGVESTWIYDYDVDAPRSSHEKTRRIVNPEGNKTVYHINRLWYGPQGLMMKVENFATASSTTPLRIVTTEDYVSQSFSGYGDLGLHGANRVGNTHSLPTKKTIKQEGDTYTTEYEYDLDQSSPTFAYTKPIKVTKYSNVSTTPRITTTTYEHNTSKWILGLTKTVTQNGRQIGTYTYDTLGRKTSQTLYGQPNATFGYHSNAAYKGALYWVKDALGRQTTLYDWKRGQPQRIRRPDNTNIYQYFDNNGWVTSSKDAMGSTTSYTRDNMGRVTLINPPGSWANTSISYDFSGGGAVQTITKGQSKETVTYDSMYRPIYERTQALDTGWSSYTNTKYDGLGRVTFKSQPSTNQYETKGVDHTYDGLGRIKTERETVAPFAETRHLYLSNHRYRIYDPSNAWTQYYYRGYDGPGSSDYSQIRNYDSNNALLRRTILYKDIWSQISRVAQMGSLNGHSVNKSQNFYYDSQQRLCRHYVPEHGATKYQYDAAGQMIAYAKGQGNSGCGAVPNVSAKVSQTYDALGRRKVTNFSDPATPDIIRYYDLNGNLTNVYRDGVDWTYYYNDLNMLTHEYLDIDGRNYDSFYYYNTSGHLTRKRMPSGRNVYYTPDGLGRSKTIKNGSATIASATSFHPNGSLAGMTYGNGQVFSQTLNARLLPQRLLSVKSGVKAIDQTLSYDARGKITSIIDGAVPSNNRTYGYDGLGQLTSATGPWGAGSYKYDSLGNLRQKKLGTRTVDLTYDDTNNRLTFYTDTAGPNKGVTYDSRGNVHWNGGVRLIHDASDQPVRFRAPTGAYGDYFYDGNLKRVKSVLDGKTIYNVYDASGSLVHIDKRPFNGEGEERTDYISGPNGTLARITNNTETYLHPDHLGSAQSGTNSAGAISWREQYTPFGEEIQSPVHNDNLPGFTGHIKDKATGLNYMQARYYDPVIGRFLSVDPVTFMYEGNPSYFNRYAYSLNDPVNNFDPDGRAAVAACAVPPVAAGCAAVGKVVVEGLILIGGLVAIDRATNATPITLPSDTAEPYVTPGGREVAHGKNSKGYIEGKGWTPEEIDDVLDDPAGSYGSSQ